MTGAVTCPFCSLLCDDIEVGLDPQGRLATLNPDCPRARAGFGAALAEPPAGPQIGGREASLAQAVTAAAELLGQARAPLVGGLDGDVAALRAALDLAERLRARVDHRHGAGLARQLAVLQHDGWITTTLSEVRNRADLVVVLGGRLFTEAPRFAERILHGRSMFQRQPELVLLSQSEPPPGITPALQLTLAPDQLSAALGAVRILLRDGPLPSGLAGLPQAALAELAERLQRAEYPVVTWSSAELADDAAGALLAGLFELLDALGDKRRAVALPLAADASLISALQVCTWRTGFPPPLWLRPQPDYDPGRDAADRLLADGRIDALLWLASLDPAAPPAGVPAVVLGHPALRVDPAPAVFIPVAVPGVDQAGQLFRSDGVALPLRALRAGRNPAAATVLGAIQAELAGAAACS